MVCKRPFPIKEGAAAGLRVGCGSCTPCRVRRRSEVKFELGLEGRYHTDSVFVTATYSDACVPRLPNGLMTLRKKDYQDWFKRLRHYRSFRYYISGEYTPTNHRPHFHVIFFGFPTCSQASWLWPKALWGTCACFSCVTLRSTWGNGFLHVGFVSPESLQYVAGYVSKFSLKKEDRNGRVKEFGRGSNFRGFQGVDSLADHLIQSGHSGDVPPFIFEGSKKVYLSRAVKRRLRAKLGKEELVTPDEDLLKLKQELYLVQKGKIDAAPGESYWEKRDFVDRDDYFRRMQAVLECEVRTDIYTQRSYNA